MSHRRSPPHRRSPVDRRSPEERPLNIHARLRQKYGKEALKALRATENIMGKLAKWNNHWNFNLKCLETGVIPKSIQHGVMQADIQGTRDEIFDIQRTGLQNRARKCAHTIGKFKQDRKEKEAILWGIVKDPEVRQELEAYLDRMRMNVAETSRTRQDAKFHILVEEKIEEQIEECSAPPGPPGPPPFPPHHRRIDEMHDDGFLNTPPAQNWADCHSTTSPRYESPNAPSPNSSLFYVSPSVNLSFSSQNQYREDQGYQEPQTWFDEPQDRYGGPQDSYGGRQEQYGGQQNRYGGGRDSYGAEASGGYSGARSRGYDRPRQNSGRGGYDSGRARYQRDNNRDSFRRSSYMGADAASYQDSVSHQRNGQSSARSEPQRGYRNSSYDRSKNTGYGNRSYGKSSSWESAKGDSYGGNSGFQQGNSRRASDNFGKSRYDSGDRFNQQDTRRATSYYDRANEGGRSWDGPAKRQHTFDGGPDERKRHASSFR